MSLIKQNERVEDLQCNGGKIIQNPLWYNFANDPILLVNFAKIKKDATVCDLCSGSGIISILVALKSRAKQIFGIEIQECVAEVSQRSVMLNNLENKIKIFHGRIQDYEQFLSKGSVDVVFCNPPYFKKNESFLNENEIKAISRHEIELNLEDVIRVASELLNSKGQFYLVHRAKRIQEISFLCSKYDLSIKELMLVQSNAKCEPHLVLIKAVKQGEFGAKILPNLVLNNLDGSFTEEVNKLYLKQKL